MGERSSKDNMMQIATPQMAKLGDQDNYWTWRILLRSYLEALGLWAGKYPREAPQSKFILLTSLEIWVLKKEYEYYSCKQIYQDLETRFSEARSKSTTLIQNK